MARISIVLALILTVFSYQPGSEIYFQMALLLSLIVAAGGCLYNGVAKVGFNAFELLVYCLCGLSLITSVLRGAEYGFYYTLSIIMVFICLSIITRSIEPSEFFDLLIYAIVGAILISLAQEYQDWLLALSGYTDDHGLFRFSPLGMHPNQTGMAYGGASIALLYKAKRTQRFAYKFIFCVFSALAISFVISASARSAILAIVLTGGFYFAINIKNYPIRTFVIISVSVVGIGVWLLLYGFDVIFYFFDIFELDSASRGIDSGGSGRTELWELGLNLILEEPLRFVFGGGFRTSNYEDIGFFLESSYLTLMFELGIVATLMYLFVLFQLIGFAVRRQEDELMNTLGYLIMYLCFQSIFNRYLLAIGNFYSLAILFICFYVARLRARELSRSV